ncbi:MAG: hypothetical protein J5858_11895 [Lentisphaeria bacterium]|nr:hypothetical protein [Lentisphaeria bacterium]
MKLETWEKIKTASAGLEWIAEDPVQSIQLPPELYCFYSSDDLGSDGFPQNGSLWEDGSYEGRGCCSVFDVTAAPDSPALLAVPVSGKAEWKIIREGDRISFLPAPGVWRLSVYRGNEPDWRHHEFPFRDLPEAEPLTRHAWIRGLLDFLSGTRRSPANGVVFQSPQTSSTKGYSGDGIPDTFFQFTAVYRFLSEKRKSFFRSQLDWLGNHMRFDGCIPWGGCRQDMPYYHIWKRSDCGMFFDGNGLWLEMTRLLYRFDRIMPDPEKVIRAADFYLHYMTESGLVAAESKMKGCEWADLLRNGWHSSLINVIAYRGLDAAADLMEICHQHELADRYLRAAARLKKALNRPLAENGLFTGTGFVDWRDVDGGIHPHWRIDTNMLAIVWNVIENDKIEPVVKYFLEKYFRNEPSVPAPYLLDGAWYDGVHDDMLEGIRTFGCGSASMPGRMCGPLIAAMRKTGRNDIADHFLDKIVKLILHEPALWEYYDPSGKGTGARSYIEHALTPLYALGLSENINTDKRR